MDVERGMWGNSCSAGSSFFRIVPGDLLICGWTAVPVVMEPVFAVHQGHLCPLCHEWGWAALAQLLRLHLHGVAGRCHLSRWEVSLCCPRALAPAGCTQLVWVVLGQGSGLRVTLLAEIRCWGCWQVKWKCWRCFWRALLVLCLQVHHPGVWNILRVVGQQLGTRMLFPPLTTLKASEMWTMVKPSMATLQSFCV